MTSTFLAAKNHRNMSSVTSDKIRTFQILVLITLSVICSTNGLHITGTFNPKDDFFHFLAKFGFQKTELRRRDDSQGFIYGNVTVVNQNATFSPGKAESSSKKQKTKNIRM
jgi:hypothetical protein